MNTLGRAHTHASMQARMRKHTHAHTQARKLTHTHAATLAVIHSTTVPTMTLSLVLQLPQLAMPCVSQLQLDLASYNEQL